MIGDEINIKIHGLFENENLWDSNHNNSLSPEYPPLLSIYKFIPSLFWVLNMKNQDLSN